MRDKLIGAALGIVSSGVLAVAGAGLAVWRNDALQDQAIRQLVQELTEAKRDMRRTTRRLEAAVRVIEARGLHQAGERAYLPVLPDADEQDSKP